MKRFGLIDLLLAATLFVAIVIPAFVIAQTTTTGPTFKGFDLSPLIAGLVAVVGAVFAWLARRIAAAQEASAEKSRAETALLRLGAIALAMVGDLWAQLSAEFQKRIADGQFDAEDREAFRQLVQANLEKYTSADELKKIAEALGLPLPGIIAKVAEFVIDRLTKAHDPAIPDVSAKAYPVDPASEASGG